MEWKLPGCRGAEYQSIITRGLTLRELRLEVNGLREWAGGMLHGKIYVIGMK
jgi:hypothetical protein